MSKAEKLSPYLWKRDGMYLHWCQACKCGHIYNTLREGGPNWTFNGNIEKPSFTPSMLIYDPLPDGGRRTICHYFVTDGEIIYQPDCPHALAGQKLPLEPIPKNWGF